MRARLANSSSSPPGPFLHFAARCVDVTPSTGSPMAGYMARGREPAIGLLDPLEATLVRLRDPRPGGGSVTWVALDALAVDVALARSIAEAVAAASDVAPDDVVVCASHTHAGPSGWLRGIPFAAPEPGDPDMRAQLIRRIGGAAGGLARDELQVRTHLAVGEATGVGTNRTDPGTPSDRSLGALTMVDDRGAAVGLLVDHASHATVLGHDNRRWSADWPGAGRRTLAHSLRGQTPFAEGEAERARPTAVGTPIVAFLQGAAGDASPRFVRRGQSPAEVDRIGGLFAAQALVAVLAADRSEVEDSAVAVRRRSVPVPTRALADPAVLAQRVETAEREWRTVVAAEGSGTPAERIARTRHEGALTAAALAVAGLPSSLELPVSVVVVGPDAWLHVPVELFSSFAVEIREASPFRQTRVIGYADGYFGYVADAEAHERQTYEASSSPFDPAGSRTLVDAAIDLLRRTHDELWPGRNRA